MQIQSKFHFSNLVTTLTSVLSTKQMNGGSDFLQQVDELNRNRCPMETIVIISDGLSQTYLSLVFEALILINESHSNIIRNIPIHFFF